MFEEVELIMLILGIGVLVLAFIFKTEIKRLFAWKNLMVSYYFLLAGWFFTVAEAFLWPFYLNLAEHICYAASAVILAVWCFRFSFSHKSMVS
jgi:hypothetical protein